MIEGSGETGRIERDLEHTRARLDATLDELQAKLSPGQMVDQAMSWFKEGGGQEFGRNFGRSVRDNPLPLALIGIGVGWLMLGGGPSAGGMRQRFRSEPDWRTRDPYPDYDAPRHGSDMHGQPLPYEAAAYDDLALKANEAGARIERQTGESDDLFNERLYTARGSAVGVTRQGGESLQSFRDRIESTIEAAADRLRRMGRQVSGQVSALADAASSRASGAASQGRGGLRSIYGYGQSAAYSAREGASYASYRARDAAEYVKDQPLLMGALGVAVGAVLAMLVPPTRYEREVAGDLRRTLGDQARNVASDLSQRAARVADDVIGTAKEAARREGLADVSPSGVAQQARAQVADAAGRVRNVVEETAAAGREATEREFGSSGRGAGSGASGGSTMPGSGNNRPSMT